MGDPLLREESTHILVLFQHENWEIVQFSKERERIYVVHRCDKGDWLVSIQWEDHLLETTCWSCKTPVPTEITTIRELHRV